MSTRRGACGTDHQVGRCEECWGLSGTWGAVEGIIWNWGEWEQGDLFLRGAHRKYWRDGSGSSLVKKGGRLNREWRAAVMERDGRCVDCGSGEALHAHHIVHWADDPGLRFDVSNGEALCFSCHSGRHPEHPKLFVA